VEGVPALKRGARGAIAAALSAKKVSRKTTPSTTCYPAPRVFFRDGFSRDRAKGSLKRFLGLLPLRVPSACSEQWPLPGLPGEPSLGQDEQSKASPLFFHLREGSGVGSESEPQASPMRPSLPGTPPQSSAPENSTPGHGSLSGAPGVHDARRGVSAGPPLPSATRPLGAPPHHLQEEPSSHWHTEGTRGTGEGGGSGATGASRPWGITGAGAAALAPRRNPPRLCLALELAALGLLVAAWRLSKERTASAPLAHTGSGTDWTSFPLAFPPDTGAGSAQAESTVAGSTEDRSTEADSKEARSAGVGNAEAESTGAEASWERGVLAIAEAGSVEVGNAEAGSAEAGRCREKGVLAFSEAGDTGCESRGVKRRCQ